MSNTKRDVILNARWKEILFAGAGFGPNLLMVLMMAYFTDAIMPAGLNADILFWSYSGTSIVSLFIFPVLWTLSRAFDGIIDIPLAGLTDSLKSKTGKRYLTLIIAFLPMLVSFVLTWIPICGYNNLDEGARIGNSLWIIFWALVFFASYTLGLITFYGSLSEVCSNQTQRARVSAYKSVFDTISYALVYAAIPALFKMLGVPIWKVALYGSPLMVTILIPLFLKGRINKEENNDQGKEENVPLGLSIALTIKSKPFMTWLIVNCVAFFGLQMFLVSQNTLISGVMNLGAGYAAILNTCAFAPVPLMLYFFNKYRKKYGIRVLYQTCLISFAIAIFAFNLGSEYICGSNTTAKLIIGCAGSVIGSWAIGAFFMVPYLIPTIIASVEDEITHHNHSAMYFAVQAFATSIVGAIASSLIYNYLKLWVKDGPVVEWKCGVSLIPLIVAFTCIVGFFFCFKMPKKYTANIIYSDIIASLNKDNETLNNKRNRLIALQDKEISSIQNTNISEDEKKLLIEEISHTYSLKLAKLSLLMDKNNEILKMPYNSVESSAKEEDVGLYEQESILANVLLFVLSFGIFGIFDRLTWRKKLDKLNKGFSKGELVLYILSFFIPFVGIFIDLKVLRKLDQKASLVTKLIIVVSGICLPLWNNIVGNSIITNEFNNLLKGNTK